MRLIITLLAFNLSNMALCQTFSATPLEDGDVEKFIKTYKPLSKEVEELGTQLDNLQDYSMMQALAANSKVNEVFTKYGWEGAWWEKFMTIVVAYTIVNMDQQLAQMPPDERKQVEKYMSASIDPMRQMVTEADIEKVGARKADLDVLFEND